MPTIYTDAAFRRLARDLINDKDADPETIVAHLRIADRGDAEPFTMTLPDTLEETPLSDRPVSLTVNIDSVPLSDFAHGMVDVINVLHNAPNMESFTITVNDKRGAIDVTDISD